MHSDIRPPQMITATQSLCTDEAAEKGMKLHKNAVLCLIAIITYWKSFEAHEKSHRDKPFKQAFSNLMQYCDDTKELGYNLLWQGEK